MSFDLFWQSKIDDGTKIFILIVICCLACIILNQSKKPTKNKKIIKK